MVNTLQITRNLAGLPVGLHLKGQSSYGINIDQTYALFQVSVGELMGGSVILKHPASNSQGDITVALDTHADDNGVNGATAHAELIRLTTHTKHPHSEVVEVNDPLEALRAKVDMLEPPAVVPLVTTWEKVRMRTYLKEDGTTGFGFHFYSANGKTNQYADNPSTFGLDEVSEGVRHLVVRYYNEKRNLLEELRCPIATNDFAGFSFIKNGLYKSYTGADAYLALIRAEDEASGSASGTSGRAEGIDGNADGTPEEV